MTDANLYNSLGMLNSSLQGLSAAVGQVKDKDWIANENKKARTFQYMMWNEANKYNMPSAVLQRWRDAGVDVNPNYLLGSTPSMQASTVSAPGHSAPNMNSKDASKYLSIMPALQMSMQKDLVDSQLQVNQSIIAKNEADANETTSRIPINEEQKNYLEQLVTGQSNENIWFDLSLPVKRELLDLQQAKEAGQVDYMVQLTKRIIAQTENDNKLTDMRINVAMETVAQQWKKIDILDKQVQGQLELWAKQGDAAERASKAAYLNAITGSKLFNLKKDQFDKFSDEQLKALQNANFRMRKENGWIDIFKEYQIDLMRNQSDYINSKNEGQKKDNLYYDLNQFIDLTKSIVDFGDSFFDFK